MHFKILFSLDVDWVSESKNNVILFQRTYAFCLHDTDRDSYRNRVDLKTLPKVEHFKNDMGSSVV